MVTNRCIDMSADGLAARGEGELTDAAVFRRSDALEHTLAHETIDDVRHIALVAAENATQCRHRCGAALERKDDLRLAVAERESRECLVEGVLGERRGVFEKLRDARWFVHAP